MFRLKLAVVIVIIFSFVLLLGAVLYWGSNQVGVYFQRGQTAYETFDHYERLSQEAYRHFKQRLDGLISDNATAVEGVAISKQRLYEAMAALRNTAVTRQNGASPAELEQIARFTAFLEAGEYRFDEVERLRQQGQREQALQALTKFSEQEIDGKFQPLIDAAIAAERNKAKSARQALEALVNQSRWIAVLVSMVAALFCLVSGVLLLNAVRKPIEALMKGTDEIAAGHLDYRIALAGGDEFAYLASHFNQMAQEFSAQQEKLRQGRLLLEKQVAERTLELRQLNEELIRMDRERREFLADVSHELRTPITVIRGEAEVTLRGKQRDAEEYKDALLRIVDLAMQLSKYVNDLLLLARAETANLQFDWDSLDLTELVAGTVEDFQLMAREKSLEVSAETVVGPIWVHGDRQRLRQVLFILGENACRYSKPGGQIKVELWANGGEAYCSLSDQGIGIPAGDLDRIFERHFRGQNALSSGQDGSGLGLPLAKAIVKAHGGRLAVTSIEELGSTFTVTLPLLMSEPESAYESELFQQP